MSELSQAEQKVMGVYRDLADVLRDHKEDLPPFAARNATKALAALWQVANGLDQDPGQIYDLEV